jgi:replicative DNA helicase
VNERSNTVISVWREMSHVRFDLLVVDHLRWLRDTGRDELTRLGVMSSRLKEAAKEYNAHALVLTQLNRGLESREDKRPGLADLRESGHLEENADNVIFLHRDDYYTPTTSPIKPTELIVGKFRDDVRNQVVRLDYHIERQWFTARSEQWKTVKFN